LIAVRRRLISNSLFFIVGLFAELLGFARINMHCNMNNNSFWHKSQGVALVGLVKAL
jgi:hypothetical protein